MRPIVDGKPFFPTKTLNKVCVLVVTLSKPRPSPAQMQSVQLLACKVLVAMVMDSVTQAKLMEGDEKVAISQMCICKNFNTSTFGTLLACEINLLCHKPGDEAHAMP